MTLLDNLLTTWINRPYLDLSPCSHSSWHVYGIDYSYRNLVKDISITHRSITNPVTLIHPISFRQSLIREFGLFQYQVSNPLQLPDELRTERWNVLCDYLTHYQELLPITQLRVIALLSGLCLHEAVLEYIPKMSNAQISDSTMQAHLAYNRAMSNLMLQPDAGTLDNLQELETIANYAPLGSSTRFGASLQLVALFGKRFGNLNATNYWGITAAQALENLQPSLDDFNYKRLRSVYHRAVVFVPLLQKDKEAVVREMNLCQSLAEELTHESRNEIENIAARENLTTVFESRTKEALWLGDIDLAEERARQMVEMEPLYSRYRLQLGEILIKQSKFEEAAKMYRSATRLGPPGTAIAWFMAGQCHEKMGDIDIACDCYLASVQMDELAISAVDKLNNLAPRLGNLALVNWSDMRLLQLQEQQKNIANQSRTSYISEASSELKIAGEKALAQI
ncbi:tetratricopeptide repeat protein [Desmonostoc muscorum LEGE 12446]|uniref:Tetratricopeptide repeat protein n=1 Tax=Desmonostoc muscorum LEGE 12446 TaxID=1828758 RepID=A0A8J7DEF8_DESMC|nr:tetratricopeptide repeat protein [Desmonostoc muscorum]MCF2152110.1 tetratricopeptide repeat protein [Desmonostoc muscorum LEGE 12446]